MQLTVSAVARMARLSRLISVSGGRYDSQRAARMYFLAHGRLAFVVALAVLVAVACGTPKDERVRSEFLGKYPGHSVESVGVGEGDGGNAYFHIRYRKPGDHRTFEQVWLYQDLGGKEWVCTNRSDEAAYSGP